jgi:hypothetical protein
MTHSVRDSPAAHNLVVPIATIPCEINLDILYHLLLPGVQKLFRADRKLTGDDWDCSVCWHTTGFATVSNGVRAYCLASPVAYACWEGNRRVLLKRLADTLLQQTENYRLAARREKVRAKLRMAVWKAVSELNPSENAEHELLYTCQAYHRSYLPDSFEQLRERYIKGMPWWTKAHSWSIARSACNSGGAYRKSWLAESLNLM